MPAILFDLDGTIANSLPCIIECSLLTCRDLNIPADEDKIISLIGIPMLQTGEIMLGSGRGEEYRSLYNSHFRQCPEPKMTAYEGMPQLLHQLKAQGIPLGIVTSKVRNGCLESLSTLDLHDIFDILVTASDDCGHKPDAGPALFACEQLALDKEHVIFVGDSHFDINCGKAAGIATCGVTWGACNKKQLAACGPDFLAETVPQLAQILRDWLYDINKRKG